MKNRILLALLVTSTVFAYGVTIPRHLDPLSLIKDDPLPVPLFDLYLSIYQSISDGYYEQAIALIDYLEDVPASDSARESLDEYNVLLRLVIQDLSNTESEIDEAYGYLAWLQESQASASLDAAYPYLESAGLTIDILSDQSIYIGGVLEGSPSILLEGTGEVSEFVAELERQIEEGYLEVGAIRDRRLEGLEDTGIVLRVDEREPWVGESLTVNGSLSTIESGLGDKNIELYLDNALLAGVVTNGEGGFSCTFSVPYRYEDKSVIVAIYRPVEGDADYYSPSRQEVIINPRFMEPQLRFNTSRGVYPGKTYSVYGELSIFGEPLEGFMGQVETTWSSTGVLFDEDGVFEVDYEVPGDVASGEYTLNVVCFANMRYSHIRQSLSLNVSRVPLKITLDDSFLLSTNKVTVNGRLESPVGVNGSLIVVELGDTTVSGYSENQEFHVVVPRSLVAPSGQSIVSVSAYPVESWVEASSISEQVLTVNLFSTLSLFLLLIILIVRHATRVQLTEKPASKEEQVVLDEPEVPESISGGFAGVYRRAVNIVRGLSGCLIKPSHTIREVLDIVKPRIVENVYRVFREISIRYERWVYGPSKSEDPDSFELFLEELREKSEED